MDYVRLTGDHGAFGWQCRQEGAWQATLGGCGGRPCLLIGEKGERSVSCDASGTWRGDSGCGRILCVAALPEGEVLLYDVQRLSRQEARVLCRERSRPQPAKPPQDAKTPQDKTTDTPDQEQQMQDDGQKMQQSDQPIRYRTPAQTTPVDALPALQWPDRIGNLRAYFEKNRPIRLFDWPQWRMIRWQNIGGAPCYVGVRIGEERISAVMYAVKARGGLLPPKGLSGYRYQQGQDGGYWTLVQAL